ncbi:MAG: GAF domain-containing protein, partial [Chloroflexi bacterium]|nr:GAF domain-containing protein [Chloroflexota bacterium]
SERKFTEADERLLSLFAVQTAAAIQNARLFEETRRRAEEITSLLNASLSLSTLDLQETLHIIGERARSLFRADGCRIFLLEPDNKTLRCVLALAESEVAFADLTIPLGYGVTGHVALTGEAEIVNDMLNDPRAQTVPGTEEEPEAMMFAPLKSGEKTIGVISIRRIGSDRPFQPNDLDLLQAFASLAASAVSNARLFEEIQARLQELEILQTLSTSLRQAHHMEEMLPLFIQYAAQVVNAAAGSIYLWEEASGEWVSRGWMTTDGHWQTDTADLRHRPGEGVTGWVGEHGEIYVTTDWRADPTNQPLPHEVEFIQNLTGGISLPLKAEEHIIGVLHLWYAERREFSAEDKRLLTAIADMAGNAIQRARLHEETTQQVKRLTALRDIDRAIASSFDLNLVFTFLLNGVLTQLNADAADILLFDSHTNMLYQAAKRGFRSARLSNLHLRLDESLAGRAARTRQLVTIPDLKAAGEAFTPSQLPEGENFKAYYAYPLVVKGELKGVLEVFHRAPLFVTSNWLDFFETLAGQAAIAIDNARLFENLERSNFELMMAYDETIEGWSRALDLRDKETEGHTRRVTELTLKLAAQLGIPPADMAHIRRGALLHDIGKMGVPDSILFKDDTLTSREWEIMRQHPVHAYEMLSPIAYLKPALDIPYCHHEKWDGTGYPQGLKGEQIPLAARIFAVVDVYDALTSDRPYRPAWTKEQALEYIREQTGKHFDPQVAAAFLNLIEFEG